MRIAWTGSNLVGNVFLLFFNGTMAFLPSGLSLFFVTFALLHAVFVAYWVWAIYDDRRRA